MHTAYKCNSCGRMFDFEGDAVTCVSCYPDEYYICDTCNREYFDEDLAKECEEGHG